MYKRTITHFGKTAAVAMALWLTGCDKDSASIAVPTSVTNTSVATDSQIENVAKALAKRFGEDASARKLLKSELLKQFDGDYDVLYTELVKQRPEFGKSIAENVAQRGIANGGISELLQAIPYLNISLPVNIDKWDAETYSPLVVAMPRDYKERDDTQKLKAFDKDGNIHLIDSQNAPDYPIIVLGPSERIKKDIVADAAYYKNKNASLNNIQNKPSGIQGCQRANGQIDHMRGMWMRDLSYYEDWALGAPEIILKVIAPTTDLAGNAVYNAPLSPYNRSSIDNAVWDTRVSLFPWDKNIIGDKVYYIWIEEDDTGSEIEVSASVTYKLGDTISLTGGIKYKYKNGDDVIGQLLVPFDYCPGVGYYTLGAGRAEFHWGIDNKN